VAGPRIGGSAVPVKLEPGPSQPEPAHLHQHRAGKANNPCAAARKLLPPVPVMLFRCCLVNRDPITN
jgi:hypothetical protein